MRKDLLEKELKKELRKFKWQRRVLRWRIFYGQQKLKIDFLLSKSEVVKTKEKIKTLVFRIRTTEKSAQEEAFFRLYLRKD